MLHNALVNVSSGRLELELLSFSIALLTNGLGFMNLPIFLASEVVPPSRSLYKRGLPIHVFEFVDFGPSDNLIGAMRIFQSF